MNGLSFTRSRTRLGALLLSLGLLIGASPVCAQTPLADGQVIKIDQAAGKITIKEGRFLSAVPCATAKPT